MPTIYYVRHGKTEWNALGRFQGLQDIPLNDLGRAEAVKAGDILRKLLAREGRDPFGLGFVTSPLIRARGTMELMRGALDLSPHDYSVDDRLREVGYGHWEGLTLAEMKAANPDVFAAREADKWSVAPPGGESYASATARLRDWYRSLRTSTVAVAHSGTARALMAVLGLQTAQAAASLRIEQGAVYVLGEGEMIKHG
ncbi:phosphoglycerate/bisphosphoglycerate mutase [Nitrobacter winogradskyi Nb-255]|uniref:Phosphoglycerate/bisphosphoglycerate mutase n=1 Tax=Nitrobacter winogradskyi (strain ATCC 25391 / DSM 10237 / CIP 104748 / NCIMB 11846 / Nb-255) TaxID=323098 RepID=Q3SUZ6_NITWN|nr:histidine phosphatase family protein [Nitrobacter winogradskyi]ABA03895.1 phosphoglycerate/bisphosphoglycerate mutase [Nitrobacter winogradskyi Nb-255]